MCRALFANFLAITLTGGCLAAVEKLPRVPPKSPSEAAQTFRVLDGFRMELVATEPLVASPVAMAYDEDGRAYVCEMRDYPYTDKTQHKPNQENPTDAPIGRLRLLEDTDGDGIFDKATIFAEDLSWPTGVACWKGGVFVAATPDIWYLKDTDSDGRADVRRKIFTGFRKLNVQAVMNNLVWALDNHLHGAGGSNGGQIRPGDSPDAKPFAMTRADFRFDPETEKFDLLSGGARFGGSFDDWGNRFLCNIRNPAQHIVLPARYLARNPWLAARSPLNDMAESGDQLPVHPISQPEPWRVLRARRWAGERDIVMPRSELVGAGVVTSASGVTSYRGAAYPEKYRGNVFVCECAGNLFYRLALTPDGVTFKAARVDGDAEMVASTDNWFRPVNFINAPDGTLHVLDMYRENIEHPWSIPDDIHTAVDLESGREMGRIWRLTPPDFSKPKPPHLGGASIAELAATLENPNSWWRETAQRLLVERQEKSAAPLLREMVKSGRTAQGRVHALWTLDGLGALDDDDVLAGLGDAAGGVRENALLLAEPRLARSEALRVAILKHAGDSDARVRFQAALSLGELADSHAVDSLALIASRAGADPWMRSAVLSSAAKTSGDILTRLLGDAELARSATSPIVGELARVVAARGDTAEMQRVLAAASGGADAPFREIVLGLGEGLQRSGKTLRNVAAQGPAREQIEGLLARALTAAADLNAAIGTRADAIRWLALDDFDRVKMTLASLLEPRHPQEVQSAAVAAIGSFASADTAPLLLTNWNTFTPAIRAEVIVAMLSGSRRVLPLLRAIESGAIPANQVPFARRALLLRSTDAQVKERATKLFGDAASGSRKDAIEKYKPALDAKGDAARGRKIFETTCAPCHLAGGIGSDLGPNLATIRQWNPEQVLINILDPNREVAPNFVLYIVEMKDGRVVDGIVTAESAGNVTLKRLGNLEETLLRGDIARITGSSRSFMPEGLEAAIGVEQMADLLAFLLR